MVRKDYLIAYDISSNKTRLKLANLLENELLCLRKNKSVFLGRLTVEEKVKIFEIMEPVIRRGDSILIFQLCKTCMCKAEELTKDKNPDNETIFIE